MSTQYFTPKRVIVAMAATDLRSLTPKALFASTLVALAIGASPAQAASALPPVHKHGAVSYLSGGVGEGQSAAIEKAEKHWPLSMEFAVKDKARAEFAAGVNVIVRDAKGHTALRATAGGPFLLARLAPGHYTVQASLDGKVLHENVIVAPDKPAKAMFLWPAGTDEHAS